MSASVLIRKHNAQVISSGHGFFDIKLDGEEGKVRLRCTYRFTAVLAEMALRAR
jgi:hypothetical protein